MENIILNQIQNQEISAAKAYKLMYPKQKHGKLRRAHFIKIKINIPGEKGVNRLMKALFLFPMPLIIVRLILRFVKQDKFGNSVLTKKEIMQLISYRGIKVDVTSHDKTKILIKTI